MRGLEAKIILLFAHKRKWDGDCTPWTTVEEVAQVVGASWRRTNRALHTLGDLGVIKGERSKRWRRFHLMFNSPYDHAHEQQRDRRGKLDVSLDAEGQSSSGQYADLEHNSDQNGRQNSPVWTRPRNSDDNCDQGTWRLGGGVGEGERV